MDEATRIAAKALGAYAGLIAVEHGVFEILQGDVAPGGVMINAIGPPCQAEAAWHACLPALTIIPNVLATGIMTVMIALIAIIWSIGFVGRKRGGLILISLSIIMLLVGGGFVAPFTGLVAGIAGTRIDAPLQWWRERLPTRGLRALAALWPWTLVAVLIWFPGGWILGHLFNRALLNVSVLLFIVFDVGLPVLTVISALAYQARQRGGKSDQPPGSARS